MTKKKWKREDITPEILRQLLHLDEETGKLYWKERGPEWFNSERSCKIWNKKNAEKEVYHNLKLLGVKFSYTDAIAVLTNRDFESLGKSPEIFSLEYIKDRFFIKNGKLHWKYADAKYFKSFSSQASFNKTYAGKEVYSRFGTVRVSDEAGGTKSHGYIMYCLEFNEKPGDEVVFTKNGMAIKGQEGFHGKDINNSYGFVGVTYVSNATCNNFKAQICSNSLGRFSTPIEAAKAYDKAAFDKWGTNARLNFPEDYGLTDTKTDDIPDGYFD